MTKAPITLEEVWAAVEKGSLYDVSESLMRRTGGVWPLTKADVVAKVAEYRAGTTPRDNQDIQHQITEQGVKPGPVERHLAALVEQGKIFVLPGSHWAFRYIARTRNNATYYIGQAAKDRACARQDEKRQETRDSNAHAAAIAQLVEKHAEELAALEAAWLTANPFETSAERWEKERG